MLHLLWKSALGLIVGEAARLYVPVANRIGAERWPS